MFPCKARNGFQYPIRCVVVRTRTLETQRLNVKMITLLLKLCRWLYSNFSKFQSHKIKQNTPRAFETLRVLTIKTYIILNALLVYGLATVYQVVYVHWKQSRLYIPNYVTWQLEALKLHHRWHWITGIYEKLKETIFNLTTSIDDVAPLYAKTFGGAVMTKFMYRRI